MEREALGFWFLVFGDRLPPVATKAGLESGFFESLKPCSWYWAESRAEPGAGAALGG